MGIKTLIKEGSIRVWKDVYDARLDDKAAPDLGDILRGEEESIYSDSEEFYNRTHMTHSMEGLLEETAETLKGGKGGAIFLLTSLFGGGKTHTQISLYHAFTKPEKLKSVGSQITSKISETPKPLIIVMDASRASLVPHPDEPYKTEGFTIKTIWGMLAYRLGAYAKIKHLDTERAPAPDADLIRTLLSEAGEPVLILMDEIVHYVFNMDKSKLREYGDKVVLFLDYLARAVESCPRVVLVASVQAEYRTVDGQKRLFEEDIFKGYASKILNVLSRESTRIVVPVTPDDVIKVLQRRIFKEISEEEALKARDRLHKAYRGDSELFGVESDWQYAPTEAGRIATAKDTFPFHPRYMEVLQEFVTRNKDLQKTRDAIRTTRKVVRRFLKDKNDADFIMPWHIDIRDRDIRSRVLTESRREFEDVASKDIATEEGRLGSVRECSKPELSFRIATAVLLKTYTYETFKEPLKVFPDMKNIALMVYEPETFLREKIETSDLKTAVEEMLGTLPHFASEDERYWFTPFPSVIEYVEKKAAEKIRDATLELYKSLVSRVKGILIRKESKKGVLEHGALFSEKNTTIIGFGDEVWGEITVADDPTIKLVILAKPGVTEEEVHKIVLMTGETGRRTFRNTVAVVVPVRDSDFETSLLLHASRVEAAQEVMDSLTEYYADKEIRDLQQGKLKRYSDNNGNLLDQQLLATFTKIAYPAKGKTADEIRWTSTTASSSLILQVEAGLKDPSTGPKIRTDFSFKDLAEFLKQNQNWDLVEGDSRREFRDIVNVFHTVTTAPFTTRIAVEQAVKRGTEDLEIGVESDGVLYWKRVGPEDGGDAPTVLKDTAEILPYKLAAKVLKDKLVGESGETRVGGEIHLISYSVEVAGRKTRLEDLVVQKDWEKAVKEGTILKQEQVLEKGFLLRVTPTLLVAKPNENVKTIVYVEPVGAYSCDIELVVDRGKITPNKGKAPLKAEWRLGILEPRDYNFNVTARGTDGSVSSSILTITVESKEKEEQAEKLDLTHAGAKLIQIIPENLLSLKIALDLASKLNLNAEANTEIVFADNMRFTGNRMDVKLAGMFIQKFSDILRSLPSLEKETKITSRISLIEPIVLDSAKITALAPLSEKAHFLLRVEKHD